MLKRCNELFAPNAILVLGPAEVPIPMMTSSVLAEEIDGGNVPSERVVMMFGEPVELIGSDDKSQHQHVGGSDDKSQHQHVGGSDDELKIGSRVVKVPSTTKITIL